MLYIGPATTSSFTNVGRVSLTRMFEQKKVGRAAWESALALTTWSNGANFNQVRLGMER